MQFFSRLKSNLINIPGWSTKRKIIVFESDDWGSIRMSSKANRDSLIRKGFDFSNQPFNMYDALESNTDMEALFEVLMKHRDATGRPPVFTAVSLVANPDFDKIRETEYTQYYYKSLQATLEEYPSHDRVISLYKKGVEERLFYPVLHGREHLNVNRWMQVLRSSHSAVLETFEKGVTAVHLGPGNEFLGDFQAAFDVDKRSDLNYQTTVLNDAVRLFNLQWGFYPEYFVAPNGPFNNILLEVLNKNNIKLVYGERIQNEPLGDGKYSKHFHYTGKKTRFNQYYITRNAMFEPSLSLKPNKADVIQKCLKNIEYLFLLNKPVIISSHRVNYIGFIEEDNRSTNLKLLDELLASILVKWPEVEFITSVELGELIKNDRK